MAQTITETVAYNQTFKSRLFPRLSFTLNETVKMLLTKHSSNFVHPLTQCISFSQQETV